MLNGVNGINGYSDGVLDLVGLDMNVFLVVEFKMFKLVNFVSVVYFLLGWERGYNWFMFKLDGVLYEDG